jgi:hypothetical protein
MYDRFEQAGKIVTLVSIQVICIPDVNIGCQTPIVKGERTFAWIKYNPKMTKFDVTNKELCERLVGMKLQPVNSTAN